MTLRSLVSQSNRTIWWKWGGKVLVIPRQNIFSSCGKLVGHFPVCSLDSSSTKQMQYPTAVILHSSRRWCYDRQLLQWRKWGALPAGIWIYRLMHAPLLWWCQWKIMELWLRMGSGCVQKTTLSTLIWPCLMQW